VAADYGKLSMSNAGLLPDPGAIRVVGGYRFNPYFALEAGVMAIGDSTVTDSVGSVTLSQSSLQASSVISLPLGDKFSLFGKIGVASNYGKLTGTGTYSSVNTNATTTGAIYGIGAQFRFNQLVGIRLQYEKLGKSKANSSASGVDLSRASAGVIFSF
jgi:OOP family OmpA-OmpF porin